MKKVSHVLKNIHFLFLNNSTFSVYFLNFFLTAGTVWVRLISKTIFFFISFPNVPPHTKLSPTLGQKGIFAATIGKFVLARKNCELWARGGDSVLHLFRIYIQSACCTIEKPPVFVIQPSHAEALDCITGPLLYFNAFFSWISNRKCYSNQLSPQMYVDRVHNVGAGWLGEVWGKRGGCKG